MISVDSASKQVKRLAQMKGFPREQEALKELVKALQMSASEEQSKAVISGFVEQATSETPCPFPGDIRNAVKAMQDEIRPDPLCQKCEDGWVIRSRAGYSAAERCSCWAPRPAPKMEYVPLPGSPGYIAPMLPSRDEIAEQLDQLKAAVKL